MRKIWVLFIALIVVIGTAVIFGRYPFPVVQPPDLGDGPITLRVVRAINDRFNSLTEEEFESVLDQTVRSVRYHFGLEVRFERGDDYTIAELFQLIPEPAEELALSLSYTPTAVRRLARGTYQQHSVSDREWPSLYGEYSSIPGG